MLKKTSVFLTLTLLLLCAYSLSYGTSIVVLADNDKVLIAADSKSLNYEEGRVGAHTSCKINVESNFVFASAGNTSVGSKDRMYFDVNGLIRKISHESKSVRETVDSFTKNVKKPLAISINTLRRKDPQHLPPGPALSTVFITFENGQPIVYLRNFHVRFEQEKVLVDVQSSNNTPSANGHLKLFIGVNEEMTSYDARHPDWAVVDAVEGIKHLINLEIKAHPDKVGPPIDIYLLRVNGGQWLQENNTCIKSNQ